MKLGRRNAAKAFIEKHGFLLIFAALALLAFYELAAAAAKPMATQFWEDEYYSLAAAMQNSLGQSLKWIAANEGNGVAFDVLLFVWYRIVPYGERYLLLLPAFFAALSVFTLGVAGRKIGGNICGVAAAILLLSNVCMMQYGNELRAYSMSLFTSALLIYTYTRLIETRETPKTKNFILYALAIALAMLTNYHSLFIIFILFIFDVVYVIKSRSKGNAIRLALTYAASVVLFLPWGIYFVLSARRHVFWQTEVPTIGAVYDVLKFLCGDNSVLLFVCICAIIFFAVIQRVQKNSKYCAPYTFAAVFAGFVAIMAVTSLILINVLHKGGFWVLRYFVVSSPFGIISAAAFIALCINSLKRFSKSVPNTIVIAMFLFFSPSAYTTLQAKPQPPTTHNYSEVAAEWIYSQPDILNEDVAVLVNFFDAYFKYTITHDGQRTAPNHIEHNIVDGSINKIYVVQLERWRYRNNEYNEYTILNDEFDVVEENPQMYLRVWHRKGVAQQ